MRSEGPGMGCIFTLKIRLTAPAPMVFDTSLGSSESLGDELDTGTKSLNVDLERLPSNPSKTSMDGIKINSRHSSGKGSGGIMGGDRGDCRDDSKPDGMHRDPPTPTLDSYPPRLLHLLVVDDSALNRRMILKLLSTHKCDQAEDGVVAVQRVADRIQACAASSAHFQSPDSNTDDHYHIENENQFGKFEFETLAEERKGVKGVQGGKGVEEGMGGQEGGVIALRGTSPVAMYDAILMDFMMPNMEGPRATEIIRSMGYTGKILGITGERLRGRVIMKECVLMCIRLCVHCHL